MHAVRRHAKNIEEGGNTSSEQRRQKSLPCDWRFLWTNADEMGYKKGIWTTNKIRGSGNPHHSNLDFGLRGRRFLSSYAWTQVMVQKFKNLATQLLEGYCMRRKLFQRGNVKAPLKSSNGPSTHAQTVTGFHILDLINGSVIEQTSTRDLNPEYTIRKSPIV